MAGFLAFLTLFALLPASTSTLTSNSTSSTSTPLVSEVSALTWPWCGETLGINMNRHLGWDGWMGDGPPASHQARMMTAQESYGWNIGYVHYFGETADSDDRRDKSADKVSRGRFSGVFTAKEGSEAMQRVENHRRAWSTCFSDKIAVSIANGLSNTAQTFAYMVSSFTVTAFSGQLICDRSYGSGSSSINDTGASCVDLVGLLGGTGSGQKGEGLIGALTSNLYMPMIILVALVVAVYLLINGVIKMRIRESLFGIIWALCATVAGLALLFNPGLLAQAPAKISTTLGGCVIAAFSGENCLGDSSAPLTNESAVGSDQICNVNLVGAGTDSMALVTSSLNCQIWKSFVLEPYAQASFGTNFTNLDTKNAGSRGAELAKNADVDGDDFCVPMVAAKPIKDMSGKTLEMSSSTKICNIALYQAFLLTDARDVTGSITNANAAGNMVQPDGERIDRRWYRVVSVAANDQGTWNAWAGSPWSKVGVTSVGLIATILGSVVLIALSVYTLLFFFTSTFLMVLAPVFFLVGVHPGRGRKILLGWAEMVLSNILKYVASAVFLVVGLAMYAGVLGSATSVGMMFILVLILSMALFMYRAEIVDLLGTVNMGGEQVGTAATNRIKAFAKDKVQDTKRLATTTAMSAVGGAMAGGAAGGARGAWEGIQRETIRPGGLFGNVGAGVARGFEYGGKANEEARAAHRSDLDNAVEVTSSNASDAEENAAYAFAELNNVVQDVERTDSVIAESTRAESQISRKVNDFASKGGEQALVVAEYQYDLNSVTDDLAVARKGEDVEAIAELEEKQRTLTASVIEERKKLNDVNGASSADLEEEASALISAQKSVQDTLVAAEKHKSENLGADKVEEKRAKAKEAAEELVAAQTEREVAKARRAAYNEEAQKGNKYNLKTLTKKTLQRSVDAADTAGYEVGASAEEKARIKAEDLLERANGGKL